MVVKKKDLKSVPRHQKKKPPKSSTKEVSAGKQSKAGSLSQTQEDSHAAQGQTAEATSKDSSKQGKDKGAAKAASAPAEHSPSGSSSSGKK
ncbi:hypothetical protein MG1601_123 [Mycoplasmoides gallisepticum]